MAAHSGDPFLYLDFFGIGNLVEPKLLGNLRTYLGSITIDGLTASDYKIDSTDLLDRGGKGI
jgi:hypothetical protein